MKKFLLWPALVCAAALICAAAFAADAQINTAPAHDSVTLTTDNTETVTVGVADTSLEGNQILLLALTEGVGASTVTPTVDNIVYIDQKSGAEGGAATFVVSPKELESGKTYTVWLSSNAETGDFTKLVNVGTYTYDAGESAEPTPTPTPGPDNPTPTPTPGEEDPDPTPTPVPGDRTRMKGDVDDMEGVQIGDAVKILQYLVNKATLTPEEMEAGDVDDMEGIQIGDAVKILQYLVGKAVL